MVSLPGLTKVQNNTWHSQEILGAAAATVTVALAGKLKNISALSFLTTASAGLNAIPAAATANSLINAVLNRANKEEMKDDLKKAGIAFSVTLLAGAITVLGNATNIKETHFSKLPKFTKSVKPLTYASLAATSISVGGIQVVKAANSAYEARQARLAAEKAQRESEVEDLNATADKFTTLKADEPVVGSTVLKEADIKAMDKDILVDTSANAQKLLDSKGGHHDVQNRITDDQIVWINARAAQLAEEEATKIADWTDLVRKP